MLGPEAAHALADALVQIAKVVRELPEAARGGPQSPTSNMGTAESWRERLWTCPPATRVGVVELCEALGRPRSWVYRHTADGKRSRKPSAKRCQCARLPHRRIDGELVFVVGEIRQWLVEHEVTVVVGRREPLVVSPRRREEGAA